MEQHLPDVRRLDIGSDASGEEEDSEEEVGVVGVDEKQLPISAQEVERNYDLMGVLSQPEPPFVTLQQLREEHPQAFTPLSENALASVLGDLNLPFTLSPFQEFSVNALLNQKDILCIAPTGSGKTLAGWPVVFNIIDQLSIFRPITDQSETNRHTKLSILQSYFRNFR